jgi:multicomponent Na+:H+ antiporter subunit A
LNFLNAGGCFSLSRWYAFGLEALYRVSRFQTRILQSGHLHLYLLIVILTTIGLVGPSLLDHDVYVGLGRWKDIRPHEAILVAVILAATVMVVRSPSRLSAVVALGVVGYGVAMIFLLFSAPDLAMTQLSIETLSVILLVLVIFRLPRYSSYSSKLERMRDAGVALAAGALMTALILAATALQREARLVDFFAKNTLELAQGRNVVNVILVDFRGLDTLGEITVLSVAAIGVYALIKLKDVRTNDTAQGND